MLSVAINGCIAHQDPSYHGLVSGDREAPWGKGVKEVIGTRESESGWGTYGSGEGIRGGRRGGRIRDRGHNGTKRQGRADFSS